MNRYVRSDRKGKDFAPFALVPLPLVVVEVIVVVFVFVLVFVLVFIFVLAVVIVDGLRTINNSTHLVLVDQLVRGRLRDLLPHKAAPHRNTSHPRRNRRGRTRFDQDGGARAIGINVVAGA